MRWLINSLFGASPSGNMQLQRMGFSTKNLWAIVPVKPLTRSKQRLKASLGALRPGLTLAMLGDVLNALKSSRAIKGVAIVTLDAEVALLAESMGALVVKEAGAFGMNRAIVQGFAAAKRAGADAVVVVPVDIPLLTGAECDRLVDELQEHSAAVPEPVMGMVESADRGGTNWLCIETALPFTPLYGPDSYGRHLEEARIKGRRPVSLRSPRVSLDIDEEADLTAFASFCHAHPEFQATRTWKFLHGLGRDDAESNATRSHVT